MSRIDKVIYTARTHTTGGRDGAAQSDDRHLDVRLSPPGGNGAGTNPEQLFAAGWSACFIGAMRRAAGQLKVTLPANLAVDAEVDLGTAGGRFCCRRVSTSACRVCRARWRRASRMPHIRSARTRRPRAAISMSRSV